MLVCKDCGMKNIGILYCKKCGGDLYAKHRRVERFGRPLATIFDRPLVPK